MGGKEKTRGNRLHAAILKAARKPGEVALCTRSIFAKFSYRGLMIILNEIDIAKPFRQAKKLVPLIR